MGERKAFHENLECFKRLFNNFLPRCLEAYTRMNEYFERKPIKALKIENL